MPEGRAAVPALERTELQGLHSWIARPRRKWRYRIRRAGGGDCGWLRRRPGHLRPARPARLRTLRYPDPATLLTCSGGVYTRTKLHRGDTVLLFPLASFLLTPPSPFPTCTAAPPACLFRMPKNRNISRQCCMKAQCARKIADRKSVV